MTGIRARRFLSVALAAALASTLTISTAAPAGSARLHGRVVGADGATPQTGVVVTLVHAARGDRVSASPSDAHGSFRVAAAEPGTYVVVAEGPEGAFVAPGVVSLAPGENPPVAIALVAPAPQTEGEDSQSDEETPTGEDEQEGAPEQPTGLQLPPPPPEQEGLSKTAKWLIGGGVGVLAVLAINEIGESEDPASPF